MSDEGQPVFCCTGCETVYAILQDSGYGDYYRLRDSMSDAAGVPAAPTGDSYTYLDDPIFQEKYLPVAGTMDFYLEGVHCAACVWLVEKLSDMVPGVESARLDLGQSVARVRVGEAGSFADVARQLDRLGYRPFPVRPDQVEAFQQKENRRFLIRIGVAAAALSNIMLFSVALYSGISGVMAEVFLWLSFALFIPIVTYSAVPFYQNALAALRTRRMSIDIPIVLGIVVGTVLGVMNLFSEVHRDQVYFDSLGTLILLLLGSRYLLRRMQQKALKATNLMHEMLPHSARRWSEDTAAYEVVPMEAVFPGDRVQVRVGDVVPVDGVVLGGESELNCAIITGETAPRAIRPGDPVYSGTVNEVAPLEIEVAARGADSRLGQILSMVEDSRTRRAPVAAWADRVAGWFTLVVVLLGVGTFAFWARYDVGLAFNHVMALFIITCPCALAMSAPVATLVSMGRAAKRGMLIKGADVLQRLSQADGIFLDKTGTLTEGRFSVSDWHFTDVATSPAEIQAAVFELEKFSNHPIARAIIADLEVRLPADRRLIRVEEATERIGQGVSGRVDGRHMEVRRMDELDPSMLSGMQSAVGVYVDDGLVAMITLRDRLRDDAPASLTALKKLRMHPRIVSGDAKPHVDEVGRTLGLPEGDVLSQATPESKRALIESHPRAIMVGDGANDSAALASAWVGVAVHGGMEISLRAADVYVSQPGIGPVVTLIRASRETMRVIYRNYTFSLFYNLIGGGAAVMGLMSPLFAAILMPISSLTILTSSWRGARSLR